MDRLIKLSDAIKAVSIPCGTCLARDSKDCEKCSVPKLSELINAIPSADRPQGEWIDKGDYAECSNCGADSGIQFDGVESVPRKTNFCPNCGARMDVSEDDRDYERAVEMAEYERLYEPTYNPEDGSM